MRASKNGSLMVVKFLVESGANVHACDDYALRLASEKGHLEVVKFLVESGANVHAPDVHGIQMAPAIGVGKMHTSTRSKF